MSTRDGTATKCGAWFDWEFSTTKQPKKRILVVLVPNEVYAFVWVPNMLIYKPQTMRRIAPIDRFEVLLAQCVFEYGSWTVVFHKTSTACWVFFNNFCFLREPINFCSSSHTGAACATGVAWQLWCIADRAGRLRPSCIVSPMPAPLTFSTGRARNRRGFPVAGCRARASLGAALHAGGRQL